MQNELRSHYEQTQSNKTQESFKREMADYLKQQIEARRHQRKTSL